MHEISYQIHDALEQAGLPVVSVRDQNGTRNGITITLSDPTPEQSAEAEVIADQVFNSQ